MTHLNVARRRTLLSGKLTLSHECRSAVAVTTAMYSWKVAWSITSLREWVCISLFYSGKGGALFSVNLLRILKGIEPIRFSIPVHFCAGSLVIYQSNTPHSFTVALPQSLQLRGQWDVALWDMYTPAQYVAVDNAHQIHNIIIYILDEDTLDRTSLAIQKQSRK